MFVTRVQEVHFLVPSLGASVNDYTQRALGPCANYVSTTFGFFAQTIPQYCMVCNGISEPIAVHYLYTYAGSISSAFNQATVIGLALFKICSLLLSTYGFVDGETLMDVNEESCPWRNIHKCRSKFITTAQCNDYYYGPWSIGIAAACLLGWTASLLFCHAMIPVLS
jgi:hypothetical protein